MIDPVVGKVLWVLGVIAWYVIRYPFERRAKRVRISQTKPTGVREGWTFSSHAWPGGRAVGVCRDGHSTCGGLSVKQYRYPRWSGCLPRCSACVSAFAQVTGKKLVDKPGYSRETPSVSSGPYRLVRHPMYTSFLLMAVGQALLLPNWIVALAGILGVALLVCLRLKKEEAMMLEVFGKEYESYMHRTKRMIPYIF